MMNRSNLKMSRDEAKRRIEQQLVRGRQLLAIRIDDRDQLQTARVEYSRWSDQNIEVLRRIVDTSELEESNDPSISFAPRQQRTFNELLIEYWADVKNKIAVLESMLARLDHIPEPTQFSDQSRLMDLTPGNRVFIVHGHDDGHKQELARVLERLDLVPVILHEQPNQGRAIIEKFENHSDVSFAIVLLTPDDVGAANDSVSSLQPRARQNVVFELGYFIGKLGRNRICPLYSRGVELPSDMLGIVWVELDSYGRWQIELAKELKAAGLNVDLNRLA